jgi:hypothetical protein
MNKKINENNKSGIYWSLYFSSLGTSASTNFTQVGQYGKETVSSGEFL